MTLPQFPLDLDVTAAIGWSLIHFTWQGSVLLLLLRIILMPCRSAVTRYNWALFTLVLMGLSPIATFVILRHSGAAPDPVVALIVAAARADADSTPIRGIAIRGIDWLVLFWLLGVAALSVRALVGFYLAERLRRKGAIEVSPQIRSRFEALKGRLAIRRPVRFLESISVSVPAVIGWFRPVVLIPAGSIMRFTTEQLEALVAHELAHIKRLDPFVNIFQIVVETLLFYNPAVWWVSRIIREEREACCDEIAVSICGDVVGYARVLTELETVRMFPVQAMAANGGVLKDRIVRLLGRRPPATRLSVMAPVIVGILCLAGCMLAQGPTDAAAETTGLSADQNAVPAPPAPPAPPAARAQHPASTSGSYIEDLHTAGFKDLDAGGLIALKSLNVTAADVKGFRDAGLKDLEVHDLIALKSLGVTPDYMRALQAAGFKNLTVHDYTGAKAIGVTPEFIEALRKHGLKNLTLHQVIGLRATGFNFSDEENVR